ncbi:uncharacterized protein [Argopecten irradians]|uniref:uncharacterized protein isoform X2 n=1 Tax=Argopecten irradians TaxID=31199 RepID=UPI003722D615
MATKHDVSAKTIIQGFSREWRGLVISPAKATIEDAQRYKSRLDNLVSRTSDGITEIKGYIDDVNCDITDLSIQVKRSMANNVQIMLDLARKLVPSQKPVSDRSSLSKPNDKPNVVTAFVGTLFKMQRSSTNVKTTQLEPEKDSNTEIARQLKENTKSAESMQKLSSLIEKVNASCDKIMSQEGLATSEINALQDSINSYANTIEDEKERKDRIEKQEKEEERQKWLRNPDNWSPLILKDRSNGDRFTNTDVLCVVYAMEGSLSSLQCTNMEGQIKMADWLDIQHEEQASCPIQIKSRGNGAVNLELPMEVYVPYSIVGTRHEPEIKVSINDGPWKSPDLLTKRQVTAFPKRISYVGASITSFKSFRIVVAAVPKRKKFLVDKNGLNITEGCIDIQVPPGYGNDSIKIGVLDGKETQIGHGNFLGAQVYVDLDCVQKTTKDINVKISEKKLSDQCKDREAVYTALGRMVTSGKGLPNFKLDPFLEHLQNEGVIKAKEAHDNKNHLDVHRRTKHLLEILLQRPSAAEKVLICLDKSGNSHITKQIRQLKPTKPGNYVAEEKWRSVLVFRADDGMWKVLDPKIAKKLHKELGYTLQAGNRHFEMLSLTVSDDSSEKDIENIADQFVNYGATVTLVCRHKADDNQAETFVHVLPAKQASKEISRLQEHGYTRGPMELADFNIMDGETVEFYMSGNIGLEYLGRRLYQGKLVKIPYKAHKDTCKLNCNIYVVDKKSLEQMDDDRFRGLLHYRVRAREPLGERTDAVEVTWMKISKRYLSHLSMNGDLQALGKFISSKMADRNEMHDVFVTMDTADTVKEIEQRVERQCKNDPDVIRNETTFFIWANQNKDEHDRKIEILLHAVKSYPWCEEARRFVTMYTKAGLFSELSLLSMSKLLGPEWKDLAVVLKIPEVQVDYIKSLDLSEEDAKGKMLDKFRLSHQAIALGDRLPEAFFQSVQECGCSEEFIAYVESKMK